MHDIASHVTRANLFRDAPGFRHPASQAGAMPKNELWKRAAKAALILGNLIVYIRHPRHIRTFKRLMGYWPNVCYPQTKNEKFLWRKIFDRNPLYRLVTDKLLVRQFIKMKCPDLAMSNIIWVGASPEEIPHALLKPGVVIKTNNGSGRNIFIAEAPVNRAQINLQVTEWLTTPYGIPQGEWNYRKIPPYVFIEKLVSAPADPQFVEISCHVLMGRCMLVTVEKDVKQRNERIAVYDAKANRLPMALKNSAELPENFSVPASFEKAVRSAESIARDFDYIRVDFMSAGDQLYFCECTVVPMAGYSVIGDEADGRINGAWDLRNSSFMRRPQRGIRRIYCKLYSYCLADRA
jgi:TupA-like ATPgrasp